MRWYWHRLRAMEPSEVLAHVQKRLRQTIDARRKPDWGEVRLEARPVFPNLPMPAAAPADLVQALRRDAEEILAGHWTAFGHVPLRVDDPPLWHKDYLQGIDLATERSSFKLNHRALPPGADVRVIWELSRWHHVVRLAMAAYVLGQDKAAQKCLHWLEDWVRQNPPWKGWNWTSALESGLRLIQWAWLDALLGPARASGHGSASWDTLCHAMLPSHVWYTWRYRSFGSSANNHLIGELAGLIVATARWPALERWGASLETLQALWECEVLAQFAGDGGNREQALHYHLFAWELCWQTRAALMAAGRTVSPQVDLRLIRAADFFAAVQVESGLWEYGDSDDASVTPCFMEEEQAVLEWHSWFNKAEHASAIEYWMGPAPEPAMSPACVRGSGDWLIFPESGQAVCWTGDWQLRWDVSPLGYLSTSAHGHLDALHLSIWLAGKPVVIDPGTGAYYADPTVRAYLASWEAHNGPHPKGADFPVRLGPFLWSERHDIPQWRVDDERTMQAVLSLPGGRVTRLVRRMDTEDGWQVDDDYELNGPGGASAFQVCWQFAPAARLEKLEERIFQLKIEALEVNIGLDSAWQTVEMIVPEPTPVPHPLAGNSQGICAPSFRRMAWGPRLVLTAPGHNPCLFRTTFLASRAR